MDEQAPSNNDDTGVERTADSVVLEGNDEAPAKQAENRNEDGTFKKGTSGNPKGRPKGMTLKQWARERFLNMTWDEKKAFIDACPPDLVWKMAEGMPSQDTKQEVSGSLTIEISEKIASKNKLYEAD